MIPKNLKLHRPYFITAIAVVAAVCGFAIADILVDWSVFWHGVLATAMISLCITIPIAYSMDHFAMKYRKQNKELEKLNALNKKLFALISHDVRAPLNNLKTLVDLFVNGDMDMETAQVYFGQVSGKLDNLTDFLDGLLDWSKRQTEDELLQKSNFSTEATIIPIVDLLDEQAKVKKISIYKEGTNEIVFADKNSYEFIFRNLLHNAIKFTPANGSIYINTYTKNGKVYTAIKDTGLGIADAEISKILDGTNWHTTNGTEDEKGSGFGIRTCFYYLKQNGGALDIKSKVGMGTIMTFSMPRGK
ncbi:sensor histidine kinase [Croceivirga radicis]|uniref:sensor histidine kinase n=1 Tax=Croceivirga radicis TaxID=1929488 RepID=UPI000255AEF8|nr:HAMP domain-containing sensor histidine kinase [Croceivirga radicis]